MNNGEQGINCKRKEETERTHWVVVKVVVVIEEDWGMKVEAV